MNKAEIISFCGRVPVLGTSLRKMARRYPDGSIVTIRNGYLAGCRWQRSHRYVSGYWLGIYELPIQECLVRELKGGDVFYDIGANAGFFTVLGSRCVAPEGRVFSFEPLPENVRSIRAQLGLNHAGNCTVIDAAVTDCGGTAGFCEGRDTSTAHLKQENGGGGGVSTMSVRCITLDDFTQTAPVPDFIKMDIEGAELAALQGAERLLASESPPKMLMEFHDERLKAAACRMLTGLGYRFSTVSSDVVGTTGDERHILCVPPVRRA